VRAERACTNVESMNANDLITQSNKPYGFLWHGASCYSVTVVFPRCDWKTSITAGSWATVSAGRDIAAEQLTSR
jgi:hypothetical protein